ncbi:MAG: hypothetical protein E7361_01540 [Clostridiales bacterium]|nr:hypothetical protein [Clostridiales bacterium]
MKKRNIFSLLKFIDYFIEARIAYNNAKSNPEIKNNTVAFAKRAILYIILYAGLCFGGLALFVYGFNNIPFAFFLALLALVVGIYLFLYGFPFIFISLNLVIKQLCLNKKFLGWLALVLYLVAFFGLIIAILFYLGVL